MTVLHRCSLLFPQASTSRPTSSTPLDASDASLLDPNFTANSSPHRLLPSSSSTTDFSVPVCSLTPHCHDPPSSFDPTERTLTDEKRKAETSRLGSLSGSLSAHPGLDWASIESSDASSGQRGPRTRGSGGHPTSHVGLPSWLTSESERAQERASRETRGNWVPVAKAAFGGFPQSSGAQAPGCIFRKRTQDRRRRADYVGDSERDSNCRAEEGARRPPPNGEVTELGGLSELDLRDIEDLASASQVLPYSVGSEGRGLDINKARCLHASRAAETSDPRPFLPLANTETNSSDPIVRETRSTTVCGQVTDVETLGAKQCRFSATLPTSSTPDEPVAGVHTLEVTDSPPAACADTMSTMSSHSHCLAVHESKRGSDIDPVLCDSPSNAPSRHRGRTTKADRVSDEVRCCAVYGSPIVAARASARPSWSSTSRQVPVTSSESQRSTVPGVCVHVVDDDVPACRTQGSIHSAPEVLCCSPVLDPLKQFQAKEEQPDLKKIREKRWRVSSKKCPTVSTSVESRQSGEAQSIFSAENLVSEKVRVVSSP